MVLASPSFTSENPLYKYSRNELGQPQNKFKIDYKTLVEYYKYAAPTVLSPTESNSLKMRDQSFAKIDKEDLKFEVNLRKMNITPVIPLDPETAQDLFKFDIAQYMKEHEGEDFVSAKKNAFKKLAFDKETQHFDRDYLHMSDWKSLIHPPVKDLGNDLNRFYKDSSEIPADSKMLTADFNRDLDTVSGSELTSGNKLKLLVNGISFQEKLKQVRAAKKSILVGVMTFAADPSAFEMIDLLIEKKKQGVDVQIMVEKLWTSVFFRKTINKINEGGIKLMLANDMFPYKIKDENKALFHNKIWIFDEKTAIVGGQNIVNSANNATGFNHWNKDTDVLIEGPMVTDVLKEYNVLKKRYDKRFFDRKNKQFNLNTGITAEEYDTIINEKLADERAKGLRGQENYEKWFSNPETATNGACRFVIQGPQKDKNAISKAYVKVIEAAKNHIYFVSQHIEYDTTLESASWETNIYRSLFNRGDAGVRLDLVANGIDGGFAEIGQNITAGKKSDKRVQKLEKKFARQEKRGEEPGTFMSRLSTKLGLKSTKKFGTYLDSATQEDNFTAWMHFQYVHSKTMLIDNIMASVGSYNFEPYSAEKSHESTVLCYDQRLASELKYDTIRDIVNSTPVFPLTMVNE